MSIEEVIDMVTKKMKLIRIERGYTQDKMAMILGLSKKTLVQIEKGRIKANWTTIVAVCGLFRNSEILRSTLGGDPIELVETIAHNGIESPKDKTLGGKVWWKDLKQSGDFILQQNVITHHYRILDREQHRWYSSFNEQEAYERLDELSS